jgi:hypothetical protein
MEFKPDHKPSINLEKQEFWNKWVAIVDTIADKIGHPIDSNIKETVVAFNCHGMKTDGSCEGHLDHGLPYPWVDIESPSEELMLKEFPTYRSDFEAWHSRKYGSVEAGKKADPDLYKKLIEIENYSEKIKIEDKIILNTLLNEFYLIHKPYSDNSKISAHERASNGFRIELSESRGLGLDNWKKYDDEMAKLSPDEKENYLKNNQSEMKEFTEFLKKKFFESK